MTEEKRQRAEAISTLIRLGWSPPKPNSEQALRIVEDILAIGDSTQGAYPGHNGRNQSLRVTDRELQVLHLLADGGTFDTAARDMHYSRETVKTQVKSVRAKLGAKNTTHAVAIAIRNGLLERKAA